MQSGVAQWGQTWSVFGAFVSFIECLVELWSSLPSVSCRTLPMTITNGVQWPLWGRLCACNHHSYSNHNRRRCLFAFNMCLCLICASSMLHPYLWATFPRPKCYKSITIIIIVSITVWSDGTFIQWFIFWDWNKNLINVSFLHAIKKQKALFGCKV